MQYGQKLRFDLINKLENKSLSLFRDNISICNLHQHWVHMNPIIKRSLTVDQNEFQPPKATHYIKVVLY